MKDSIFRSAIRSFFVTLFAMMGVGTAFIVIILLIAGISGSDSESEIKEHFSPTVLSKGLGAGKEILSKKSPVFLKIDIDGFIGSEKLNMYLTRQMLVESRDNGLLKNRVKALLIHINSPGGTVGDADGIYRAIKEYKKAYNVPVYGYIDGMCASGALYIAAACDKVYASEVSLVGSVGVITSPFFNLSGFMEKIGVESKTISSGKGKDSLNPFRPWKAGEDDNYKQIIDYFYGHFVNVVTSNRPELNKTRLINDFGANVFPADKAVEYGYIDGSGKSLEETIDLLAKQVGIDNGYYQLVRMERKISFGDLFQRSSVMTMGKLVHQLELPYGLDMKSMGQPLYLYIP